MNRQARTRRIERFIARPLVVAGVLLGTIGSSIYGATMTDAFASRPVVSGDSATLDGASTSATFEINEPAHGGARGRTVWGAWTAPAAGDVVIDTFGSSFNTILAVYTGDNFGTLRSVARNRDGGGSTLSRVSFAVKPGVTYSIVVDGQANTASGNGTVRVNIKLTPSDLPAGEVGSDSFANRPLLSGSRAIGVANTVMAGLEPFEPARLSNRQKTVWWKWVAPANGEVVIDTFGSLTWLEDSFDTLLTVYTGNSFDTLSEVALNGDAPNSEQSHLVFQTRAGEEYQIMVDGWPNIGSGEGNVRLNLHFTPNGNPGAVPGMDRFERRRQLTGSHAAGVAMNALFTTDAFEPAIGSARRKTVWWEWNAPVTGPVRIRTQGSSFDTMLVVFSGSSLQSLTPVAQNNDVSGARWSEVTFNASAGVSYQIVVDGWPNIASGGEGMVVLNVDQFVNPPSNMITPLLAAELEVPGLADVNYQVQATSNLFDWENVGEVIIGTGSP